MEGKFLMMIWMKKAYGKRENRRIAWLALEKERKKRTRRKEIFKV